MTDWKLLTDFISRRWPSVSALLTVVGILCYNLNVQQVNMTVQTKDKGRFYVGWDHNQPDQTRLASTKHTPALAKAHKSSRRKNLAP